MNIRAGQIYIYKISEARAVVTFVDSDQVHTNFININFTHILFKNFFLSHFTLDKEYDFYQQLKELV